MEERLARFKGLAEFMNLSPTEGHFKALGLEILEVNIGKVILKLHYHQALVASPEKALVSGGAVTSLLDTASGFVSSTTLKDFGVTATIDLRVDYLRAPEPNLPIFAEVEVIRTTKYVVFTRGVAWQHKDKPLAYSTGTFVNNPLNEKAKQFFKSAGQLAKQMPPRVQNYKPVTAISEAKSQQVLLQARQDNDANQLIQFIPYASFLNMQRVADNQPAKWLYLMLPSKHLIGNHTIPALHGGAIAGFMETSASLHLIMKMTVEHIPKVVDINIDYIRPGLLKPTYSRCKIIRFGSRLVSMEIKCWQDSESEPIAKARLQLLVDKDLSVKQG